MNRHIDPQHATTHQLRAIRRAMHILLFGKRIEVSKSARDVFTETLNAARDELDLRPETRTGASRLSDACELELTNIASRALHLATELANRGYDTALEDGLWQLYHDAKNELDSRKTRTFVMDYLDTVGDDTQDAEPVRG
jgi:hypothetical protein